MIQEIHDALEALGDEEHETRGSVWMQGWNDMCTEPAVPEYAENLVHLARDIRRDGNARPSSSRVANYGDWKVEGEAFGKGPAKGTLGRRERHA